MQMPQPYQIQLGLLLPFKFDLSISVYLRVV